MLIKNWMKEGAHYKQLAGGLKRTGLYKVCDGHFISYTVHNKEG